MPTPTPNKHRPFGFLGSLKRKTSFLAAGSALLTMMGGNAATLAEPFLQETGLFIPDIVFSTYGDVYTDAAAFLNGLITDAYGPELGPVFQDITNNALGVLGIPSPAELARNLEEELRSLPQGDITETAPAATAPSIQRDINRSVLSQQINAVLGKDGQAVTQNKANAVASMVQQNAQLAVTAQQAVSTQDAIKAMAQQEAQNTALLSTLHTELQQNRQDTAAQSLALISVSESLDQQLNTQQLERRSEVFADLEQAALARLF